MQTHAPRRLTTLVLVLGLVLTACGGGDGDTEASDGGSTVIRTDAEGNVVDEDGDPVDEDAAGAAQTDADTSDADTSDADTSDADADPGDDDPQAAAPTGAGTGEVVVDGATYALGEVVRCAGPDGSTTSPDLDGLAELMDSIDTLGIVGTGDEGRFQLYLSQLDIGARSLNLMWEQGPGEATFTASYGQVSEDGAWMDDAGTEPDETPVVLADGRVAGSGELTANSGDAVTVRFDLPIPAEATC